MEDWGFEGMEGPGAATTMAEPIGSRGPTEASSRMEWWQSPCQYSVHGPDSKRGDHGISQEEGTARLMASS